MKILIHFFVLLIFALPVSGQNLIPNGSFEKSRNLPIKSNPVNNFFAEGKSGNKAFVRNLNYWFSANKATPDLRVLDATYERTCSEKYPDCDISHSGIYCLGLVTYMKGNKTKEYREYIEIKLSKPLKPKVKTYLEFWLCRERQAELISNNIGCYFSKNKISANILTPILTTPQFNIDTIINESGAQWVKIEGSIIPDEAYSFMTMGNFFDNENTQLAKTGAPPSNYSHTSAYYLIDDIKVWQDTSPIEESKDKISINQKAIEMNQSFEFSAIRFKTNSSVLDASSYPILKKINDLLKKQKKLNLEVHGYTDSRGSADKNLKLSLARAQQIRDYLVAQGISPDRLTIFGHGETLAMTEDGLNEDHAAHRKVLFVLREL